ncbi:MAG: hypothetical protein R3324_00145 [Halobacteriales archaeon]|nr:hypothetical protein [Halobacteriales archaeon]
MATKSPEPTRSDLVKEALSEAGQLNAVPNYERGCGSLDPSSTYLRCDVPAFGVPDGEIPTFVEFSRPIPYREGHFRTFKRVNGTEFLLDATQHVTEDPADEHVAHQERVRDDRNIAEVPDGEVADYLSRVKNGEEKAEDVFATGSPFLDALNTMDLLMWVGGSYYEDPEDFIEEARTQGINKKIPVSGAQEPPKIRPFRTRLFIIHPKAIPIEVGEDEDGETLYEHLPGIVGYTYLTRSITTADVDGGFPDWAEDFEDRGLTDRVQVSDFVPKSSPEHPQHVPHPDEVGGENYEAEDDAEDATSTETDEKGSESASDDAPVVDTTEEENEHSDFERRRMAFEESPLGYQDLRRVVSKNGLLEGVQNPTKEQLLDALAESDVKAPEVLSDGGDA